MLVRYGWCQSLDVAPSGRMCIRGAQAVLERAGYVTPDVRERAVQYMENTLASAGVGMQFFAWNDVPGRTFPVVQQLLRASASQAKENGD
ncbi:hypothetical protein ABT282_30865 [Streptomyces sp. NPDC000927]|uniref:DUF6197 family protein n=1 Tax=Streptomyces sp. NPDC000927 TaxID=3154371 RepID=UPI0033171794